MLAAAEGALPPILVCRSTMRVVDGHHRLKAAHLRGVERIGVTFFDGDDDEAFVAAVMANIGHGLPLPVSDRKAAAVRIVVSHPHWSDREIARRTGLATSTVSEIRRATVGTERLHGRVGRDGRVRPVDPGTGRRRAAELLRQQPDASLREVARLAGVSPNTVRDVRDRLSRGEEPVPRGSPSARRTAPRQRTEAVGAGGAIAAATSTLAGIRSDPALRHSEAGRSLLRALDLQIRAAAQCQSLAGQLPPHCGYALARIAGSLIEAWQEIAVDCTRRLGNDSVQ